MAVAKTLDPKLKVVLIDKGKGIQERTSITSGFGGAGLFSDGKLIVSDVVGGNIKDYTNSPYLYLEKAAHMFGVTDVAPYTKVYLDEKQQALMDKALREGMSLLATNTYHLGTDGSRVVTEKLYQELSQKCEIELNTEIHSIELENGLFHLHAGEFDLLRA